MVNLTINHKKVSVPEGTTIMEAAKQVGIPIPKLCYLKEINEIGACRVCVVELAGKNRLIVACNNVVEEGMEIYTNSPRVRESRKTTVQFLLSQHDFRCATCVRSRNCTLQTLANDLNILDIPYKQEYVKKAWTKDFPLVRDSSKCIKCMRCVQICDKVQGLNIWDVANTGSRTDVDISLNRKIEDADCALCGQCITHCPVGALRERDDTEKAFKAFGDPDKITVVQIAPAVRAAWGESLGLKREEATVERLVNAIRKMGADYVFDTVFTADLTIMEEGSEFLERLQKGDMKEYPMFTSCCPGWLRFIKSQYPELVSQLSSAKSPQQMFGATTKSYFAQKLGIDPEKIFCISIMPCLAKKQESTMELFHEEFAGRDVDLVLTTREIDRMIRADHIDASLLEEGEFDDPLKDGTGAGVIFGATGGVMEAALRSAYYLATGKNPDADAFRDVRGLDGWKEATFDIAGNEIKVAVVHGLGNTRKLIKALKKAMVKYQFVEVMACPGGCVGGGGQPIHDGEELAGIRGENLYFLDKNNEMRFSHENPSVLKAYEEYFGAPLSQKAHALLHTDHDAWEMPQAPVRK
ncbi:MAG: [FeFe] hydrogenase, group A [Lachnospiraceae bacterium]|nr:[FeFe] hydrogenase, group A [Lachnospiraceae bacterium]